MGATNDRMISVVGARLQQPVADMVTALIAREFKLGDRVSANFFENGYSSAAILLLVAMIESMLQRDHYFLKKSRPTLDVSTEPSIYLHKSLRYRRHTHVRELFEVRNAIAHNHLWEVEYTLPDAGGRAHRQSHILPDTHRLRGKALPNANAKIPRTRAVRLNLQPTRIDRTDLVKAMDVFNHALTHVHMKGQSPVRFLDAQVKCGKPSALLQFKQLVDVLRNTC